MPVKIPSSLPAVEILKAENIFVMDDLRASTHFIKTSTKYGVKITTA